MTSPNPKKWLIIAALQGGVLLLLLTSAGFLSQQLPKLRRHAHNYQSVTASKLESKLVTESDAAFQLELDIQKAFRSGTSQTDTTENKLQLLDATYKKRAELLDEYAKKLR